MKIGLVGFEFSSANKGCEALSYSFLSILNNLMLDETFTVYNFTRYDLGNVPKYFKDMEIEKKNISFRNFGHKYLKSFKECDIIFDVTMGDSFSDIYSLRFFRKLMLEKYIAIKNCKKYVFLPQTYGPFYHKSSFSLAKFILKKASVVFCRDEMSQELLENKMKIKNTILSSDMAFILPFDEKKYQMSDKEKLGLNVSGLLFKGGFNKENQFGLTLNYPELIKVLIENLSKKYEVHLIPHVVDLKNDANDDDYKTCKELHEKYPNTVLAPAFDNPIDAKSYISNMDIFIGSRMHSTIASFSSGVFTIPISYSMKFEGLFGSLNYPYVVNAKKESTKSAYDMVIKYIDDKESLEKIHRNSLKKIEEKNNKFKDKIIEILKEG